MLNYDMWPRYFIGFDRMLDNIPASNNNADSGYPPYDIVKSGEDKYCIEMALAGFTKDEISVEVKEEYLTIAGDASDRHDNSDYVHKGIGRRAFQKKFCLNDTVEVKGLILPMGYSIFD